MSVHCKVSHQNINRKIFKRFSGWWCYEQFLFPSTPDAKIERSKLYIWRQLIFINKNNSTAFYREILFSTPTPSTPANFNGYYAVTGQGVGEVVGGIGNLSITYTNGATITYTGTGDADTTISVGGGATPTLPPVIYSVNGTENKIKGPKDLRSLCFLNVYEEVYNINNPPTPVQS